MSCGVPPRIRLVSLYVDPETTVEGYGPDGWLDLSPDQTTTIGRVSDAEIRIHGMIGGRRTFGVFWRDPDWMFKVNNEWAVALVDDDEIPHASFESRALFHGSEVEILHCQDRHPIHRFRVELG